MTRFILVRHGETDWNLEGRWQGQAEVPLNGRGREQAAQIAHALSAESISAIYSSDLSRARETAQVIADSVGLEVQVDPRLREIHQGEWQGLLIAEIEARYAQEFERRKENPLLVAPPGGETASEVMERVVSAVREIGQRYDSQTVAIVSHGFAIACLVCHAQARPIEQIWDLVPDNGSWQELLLENPLT
jgi:alpha-ribazole phosphatase